MEGSGFFARTLSYGWPSEWDCGSGAVLGFAGLALRLGVKIQALALGLWLTVWTASRKLCIVSARCDAKTDAEQSRLAEVPTQRAPPAQSFQNTLIMESAPQHTTEGILRQQDLGAS